MGSLILSLLILSLLSLLFYITYEFLTKESSELVNPLPLQSEKKHEDSSLLALEVVNTVKILQDPVDLLEEFLKEKGYWNEYLANCSLNFLEAHTLRSEAFILNAFEWDLTPEGYEFWLKIHNDWRSVLEDNTSSRYELKYSNK